MSGKESDPKGSTEMANSTANDAEHASAGQGDLDGRNSHPPDELHVSTQNATQTRKDSVAFDYDPGLREQTNYSSWHILRRHLAENQSREGTTATAGGSPDHTSSRLPARPEFENRVTEDAANNKDKDNQEYRGMHPSPHAEAITSPPDQTCLSDYAPWYEVHEDEKSEQVIRSGYALKQLVAQETDTAKKTLSPYFKHPASLQSLSNFFASVLQQRQEKGKMKASSTFKPPPRVTLTDTKRETWLSDLSNPSVSLRKLSRTIPHGIRGKALMDQCLAKNIPVPRAIWLAKCVGANELRAFRRKGVNGAVVLDNEQKWIREWTIVVESFIDEVSIFSQQSDWRQKVSYALSLTSQFFAEGLLDREHFLDWSLSRLEASIIETLPLVLLTIQITLSSFTASLKHGRRLSIAYLTKLDKLCKSTDSDLFQPVINRLKSLIWTLASRHPDCLVLRKAWRHCRNTFLSFAHEMGSKAQAASTNTRASSKRHMPLILNKIAADNDRISRATEKDYPPPELPVLVLVDRLDHLERHLPIDQIATQCNQTMPDVRTIVTTLVQWSTSLYRDGLDRIYLATRLIKHYRQEGHDTDEYILSGWTYFDSKALIQSADLGRLIAELTRSGDFNATRFLRWVIAKGGIIDQQTPSRLQVLLDMPVSALPPNVAGLRRMLLQGYASQESYNSKVSLIKQAILDKLPGVNGALAEEDMKAFRHDFNAHSLTCSDIFEISDDIRQKILQRSVETTRNVLHQSDDMTAWKISQLTPEIIQWIVAVLDFTGDTLMLAQFLAPAASESDMDCLVKIINIVHCKLEEFLSIDGAEILCLKLCERYRILRKPNAPQKEIALGLSSICSRISSCGHLIPPLKQELASYDGPIGIAAHTPASDVQAESTHEIDADLEAILSESNSQESVQTEHVLNTIFAKSSKLQNDDHGLKILANALNALKSQNESAFREAVEMCVQKQFAKASAEGFQGAAVLLINSGCYDLESFVDLADRVCLVLSSTQLDAALTGSLMLINLVSSETWARSAFPISRATVAMQRCLMDNPKALMPLIVRCLTSPRSSNIDVNKMLRSKTVRSVIRRLILEDPNNALVMFERIEDDITKSLVSNLVDPSGVLDFMNQSRFDTIRNMFETVDAMSLSIYQFFVRHLTSSRSTLIDECKSLAETCLETLINSQSRGCPFWRRLVGSIDPKISKEINVSAENHLLFDVSKQTKPLEIIRSQTSPDARFWSTIVEATAFSITDEVTVETGRNIESQLSFATSLMDDHVELQSDVLQNWMQAICHIVMIRGRAFIPLGAAINAVQALCGLLARDIGQWTPHTLKSIFEAAAYMADELPAAQFAQVKQNLAQYSHHPRIRFLFGVQENADNWLYATKIQPPNPNQHSQSQEHIFQPFPLRRWELLPDLSQNPEANDTALSMRLFDASKIR